MSSKKRGAIELQFNWIFVLIVGAVILLFFFVIVTKQRDVSQLQIQADVSRRLESLLSGAQTVSETAQIIETPRLTLSFDCEGYRAGGTSPIKTLSAYSLDQIKGTQIILFSKNFNIPFRATNLLFVTDSQTRYIIVSDDSLGTNILELIPEQVDRQLISYDDLMSLEEQNSNRARFIFVNPPNDDNITIPTEFRSYKDEKVSAAKIDSVSPYDYGRVAYYQKQGLFLDQTASYVEYIDDPMMLAALFSQDEEVYQCNIKRALTQAMFIADLYAKRAELLANSGLADICNSYTTSSITTLQTLKNSIKAKTADNIGATSAIQDLEGIHSNVLELKDRNQRLLDESCPTLY
ncbi:hypothetical protein GOV04_02335 [Candidatus Woesearchaeota archaeon]|nr:hypothetical protein [Candidatus Woesearchaeota archaeon]